ncbi:MAG TPA: hypothetical protein VH593_05730 [Ktedonobacteraceae bacterium]
MDAQKMLDELIEKRLCIEGYMGDIREEYRRCEVGEIIKLAIEYGKLYEQVKEKMKQPSLMIPTLPGLR